ncbi:hypothetical protein [Clostridium sp. BJN0001]|uniref:hypothetical protein n=1 Tax=Clostridium sp. BJN0001 TaxID=2930219 RepID=UPI001FD24E17|nr:hypothetical protein [Clostridium sp. BJN0001]
MKDSKMNLKGDMREISNIIKEDAEIAGDNIKEKAHQVKHTFSNIKDDVKDAFDKDHM